VILELRGIGVGEPATPALPELSATLTDEGPTVLPIGTERGPLLASLIAAGRLRPDRGEVLLDGRPDTAAIRRAVALVDTPVVAEASPTMPVGVVVREELRFAGRRGRRGDVEGLLDELGLGRWRHAPLSDLPPAGRIALLMTLAAARPGVRMLVLTSPERHGGASGDWLTLARKYGHRGIPVLVIGGHALDPVTAARRPAALS
jgi:ABC-2 type transport system ATP-binding protein